MTFDILIFYIISTCTIFPYSNNFEEDNGNRKLSPPLRVPIKALYCKYPLPKVGVSRVVKDGVLGGGGAEDASCVTTPSPHSTSLKPFLKNETTTAESDGQASKLKRRGSQLWLDLRNLTVALTAFGQQKPSISPAASTGDSSTKDSSDMTTIYENSSMKKTIPEDLLLENTECTTSVDDLDAGNRRKRSPMNIDVLQVTGWNQYNKWSKTCTCMLLTLQQNALLVTHYVALFSIKSPCM